MSPPLEIQVGHEFLAGGIEGSSSVPGQKVGVEELCARWAVGAEGVVAIATVSENALE